MVKKANCLLSNIIKKNFNVTCSVFLLFMLYCNRDQIFWSLHLLFVFFFFLITKRACSTFFLQMNFMQEIVFKSVFLNPNHFATCFFSPQPIIFGEQLKNSSFPKMVLKCSRLESLMNSITFCNHCHSRTRLHFV